MAESSVTLFLGKLSDLLSDDASKFERAEDQLRLLQSELEWMRLALRDADADRSKSDARFKLFVNQVRDITFCAEDVIDEFEFKLNRHSRQRRRMNHLSCTGTFSGPTCFASRSRILRDLDAQIRLINARVEKISINKSRYGIGYVPANLDAWSASSSDDDDNNDLTVKGRRVPAVIEETDVVGIKDDIEFVKRMLLCGDHRRMVVSVVGMGGVGKTALARNVYKCNDIKRHFHRRAFVYVSQDYRIEALLFEIMKGAVNPTNLEKNEELEKMEVHDLGSKLRDLLAQQKYLIVLDDIWSTESWDRLRSYFPDSNNGSRILLTTRNKELALYADPHSSPYELRLLNPAESWDLFVRKVFLTRNNSTAACPPELEELGRKIVGKCGGLPLAIVVLGGLLSRKERTQSVWRRVLDDINWHLSQGRSSSLEILALSYNDLPYYLKSCFLYCGIFPENTEIKASKLLHMWVAEGFVRSSQEGSVLEDVAEDYLEELLHRNMIQVSRRRSNGRVLSWRIHGLFRDLAILEAREAKFFDIGFTSPVVARRLIIYGPSETISQSLDDHKLRSLVCFSDFLEEKTWKYLLAGVKLLTVLDLEGVRHIHMLPKEIDELTLLKFLGIKRSSIVGLPSSIGKLAKLQTLDLRLSNVNTMPTTIWELQQLRHFYGWGKISRHLRQGMHSGVEQMVNLQTLSLQVGDWVEDGGLGNLTQLRKLEIQGNLWPHRVLLSEVLHKLIGLRSLYLSTLVAEDPGMIPELKPFTNHVDLYKMELRGRLKSLPAEMEFYPPNLTKLVLQRSLLDEDPMLTLEKLPNLRFLTLGTGSYMGQKMICSRGGFHQLHVLVLIHLESLEEWDVVEGALPVLRNLEIWKCRQMKRLPDGLQSLPNLKELKIVDPAPELENWGKNPSVVIQRSAW